MTTSSAAKKTAAKKTTSSSSSAAKSDSSASKSTKSEERHRDDVSHMIGGIEEAYADQRKISEYVPPAHGAQTASTDGHVDDDEAMQENVDEHTVKEGDVDGSFGEGMSYSTSALDS